MASLGLGDSLIAHHPKDEAGVSEVGFLGGHLLAEEGHVLLLASAQIVRNVDVLTVHDHHLWAQQYLLGNDGSPSAQGDGLGCRAPGPAPLPSSAAAWESGTF